MRNQNRSCSDNDGDDGIKDYDLSKSSQRRLSGRKKYMNEKPIDDHVHSTASSYSPRSIMTVRTIQESLSSASSDRGAGSGAGAGAGAVPKNTNGRKVSTADTLEHSTSSCTASTSNFTITTQSESQGNTDTDTTTISMPKSVQFTTITFREFTLVPGDNPSVNSGPPISLGWDVVSEQTYLMRKENHSQTQTQTRADPNADENSDDNDSTENANMHLNLPPRTQAEMKIPPHIRTEILREYGAAWKDIQHATKAATIARRHRIKSIQRLHVDHVDENLEKIRRGFKKILKKKKKKGQGQVQGNDHGRAYAHVIVEDDAADDDRIYMDIRHDSDITTKMTEEGKMRMALDGQYRPSREEKEVDELDRSLSNSVKKYDLSLEYDDDDVDTNDC